MQRRIFIVKGKKFLVNCVGWEDGVFDPTPTTGSPVPPVLPVSLSFDTFETASINTYLVGTSFGVGWQIGSVYVDIANYTGLQSYDTFELYISSSDLNNLNSGSGWITPYSSSVLYTGLQSYDTIESYTSGSFLNNLNNGIGWSSPYLDINGSFQ